MKKQIANIASFRATEISNSIIEESTMGISTQLLHKTIRLITSLKHEDDKVTNVCFKVTVNGKEELSTNNIIDAIEKYNEY